VKAPAARWFCHGEAFFGHIDRLSSTDFQRVRSDGNASPNWFSAS